MAAADCRTDRSLRRVHAREFAVVPHEDAATGERRMAPHDLPTEALVRRVEHMHASQFLVIFR